MITLSSVLAGSTLRAYARNDYLFEHNDPARVIVVILEGWVQLSREEADGSRTLIAVFSKGDSMAEAAALLGEKYPASAQAMSKTRVLEIEADRFLDNMLSSRDILGGGLAAIYRKLHELVGEVASLKSRTVRQRLAEFLLTSVGEDVGPSELRLPYDKALIAAKIGTSPENLSRTFAELRNYGVTLEGRNAHIEDVEKLAALLRS